MLHLPTSIQTHHALQNNDVMQDKQSSLLNTGINPSAKPFIPAAGTQPVSNTPPLNIPKSANGEGVKSSKQQEKQKDECLCFCCNQPGHLKRNCPELPYCSKCRSRGHTPVNCPNCPHRDRPMYEATL